MGGVVAAGSVQAADAGAGVLARGGSAADAAIAAMAVAFIAEPCLTSPGGSGIATVLDPATGSAETLDFLCQVPGLPGTRLDPTGADFTGLEVDFGSGTTQVFHIGRAATGVPGNLSGLLELHRRHGRLPFGELMAPAAELAEHGVPASASQAHFFSILAPILTRTPGMRDLFAPSGTIAREGEILRSPRLAACLRRYGEEATDPITRGFLRPQVLAEWGRPRGLLTPEDLDGYRTRVGPTRCVDYRGHKVMLPGYPSAGGAMVAWCLAFLSEDPPAPPDSALRYRQVAAALEVVVRARAAGVSLEPPPGPDPWDDPGNLDGWRPLYRELRDRGARAGLPPEIPARGPGAIPGNTTHVSVVDSSGMAVAITTSNGESCGEMLPDLGHGMNNFLGEEDINPLGFHQEAPGRRLTTMMCPTVVATREGGLLALGTGGSNRIRSAVLQVLIDQLDHRLSPEAAVTRPRLHREPDGTYLESPGLPATTLAELAEGFPGIRIFPDRSLFFGGVHLATTDAHGDPGGAGDPRRNGHLRRV